MQIIAAIYLTLGLLSLLVRLCVIDMHASPMVYLMFLLFFRTEECEAQLNWSLLGLTSAATAELPPETATVHRTFVFTLVYLGLYGAMLVTALYSLFGMKNSCMGSKSFTVFFVPWILVCCGVVAMDALATVYHVMDTMGIYVSLLKSTFDGLLLN